MDPLSLFLCVFSIALRLSAKERLKAAARTYEAAVRWYRASLKAALAAQERCFAVCAKLAAIRQEVMGLHFISLHTLLVAAGVNGGLFAKPRGVFGERTEQEVRDFVAVPAKSWEPADARASGTAMMSAGAAILVQGAKVFDAHHVVNLPLLHTPLHDVGASIAGDSGSALVDGLGLGGIEFGDVLSGALSAVSIGISLSISAKAGSLESRAIEIQAEAGRLDEKCDELNSATESAVLLGQEAEGISYELFQRTFVAQNYAQIRSEKHGRNRDASDLPRWILTGLLSRATRLWNSIQTPVFT